MTKKQTLKNVIPRLDRGIQGVFNFNAIDSKILTPVYYWDETHTFGASIEQLKIIIPQSVIVDTETP